MCRRCYVDDDTAGEIEKLIRQVDEKMRKAENIHLQAGDIHPSEVAPATWFSACSRWKIPNNSLFTTRTYVCYNEIPTIRRVSICEEHHLSYRRKLSLPIMGGCISFGA